MGKYSLIGRGSQDSSVAIPDGDSTVLWVQREFRFGNSVQQVCNSILLASELGIRTLVLPGVWWLQTGEFELPDGTRVINRPQFAPNDETFVVRGDFYDLRPLISAYAKPHAASVALEKLRAGLTLDPQPSPLGEDELVIHLRSGDILSKGGSHPGYGQPPLAFYQKVIEARTWTAVHIVTENDLNPICAMIGSICAKRATPMAVVSGRLKADLEFLFRARSLVVGRGTFACAVAAMSKNLRAVHMFESWFCPWGNPAVTVNKWNDRGGAYRKEILGGNWANSERQRMLMLTYPERQISDVPIQGRCGDNWKCSSPQPFF